MIERSGGMARHRLARMRSLHHPRSRGLPLLARSIPAALAQTPTPTAVPGRTCGARVHDTGTGTTAQVSITIDDAPGLSAYQIFVTYEFSGVLATDVSRAH